MAEAQLILRPVRSEDEDLVRAAQRSLAVADFDFAVGWQPEMNWATYDDLLVKGTRPKSFARAWSSRARSMSPAYSSRATKTMRRLPGSFFDMAEHSRTSSTIPTATSEASVLDRLTTRRIRSESSRDATLLHSRSGMKHGRVAVTVWCRRIRYCSEPSAIESERRERSSLTLSRFRRNVYGECCVVGTLPGPRTGPSPPRQLHQSIDETLRLIAGRRRQRGLRDHWPDSTASRTRQPRLPEASRSWR